MLKMATYPGMSLGGEVRESISLDEDDLSDVEDEVFIRDGKNGYKLAEELNVKRPLMAPRRKFGKPDDVSLRRKNRPPCRAYCKPCCYITIALSLLIGVIALVVVLVSIFPLPLDRLRDWIAAKSSPIKLPVKLLPCSNLKMSDVWSANLPILTTDSPVRTLDITGDGVEEIIFGFGTGDNYNIIPPDIFCPVFLGVPPPCKGGIIALNGVTGEIIWRNWMNDTIFGLQCTNDVDGDSLADCLSVGVEGTISIINSRNGSAIWQRNTVQMDVYVPSFIPDQNNDSIADVLSSHTSLDGDVGSIVLFSGKTGDELKRVKVEAKTFFMPQLLKINNVNYLIFGTGGPNTPGKLNVVPLENFLSENASNLSVVYEDQYKGVMTQAVLVDLTGDNLLDIVIAMYNSTIIAVNGENFKQIWNYSVPNSESDIIPTPAYFNDDNVTDFLIIYQKYDNILNSNYTSTFIIDGKTGKSIYDKPINGAVSTQIGGLTLRMESKGFDWFLLWTMECSNIEIKKKELFTKGKSMIDNCRQQFNTSTIMKLNALNQYDQPPGLEIYNSLNRTYVEFINPKSPLRQIVEYFKTHTKPIISKGQSEVEDNYDKKEQAIKVHKYGSSSFRHKDNRQGIIRDYMAEPPAAADQRFDTDYEWQAKQMNVAPSEIDADYNLEEDGNLFDQKQLLTGETVKTNRDPRSKANKSKKKNLSGGIYDYKNIRMARNRLLHDLNDVPTEILEDTYYKNRENTLRKSKFEQRDINSHKDKIKDNQDVIKVIERERRKQKNASLTLWDLESEREMQDKENGYWRGKREVNYTLDGIRKITSIGAIMNATNTSLNIVFITYWQPTKIDVQENLQQEIGDCINDKLTNALEDQVHNYLKTTEEEQRALFMRECITEQENMRQDIPYFNQLHQLRLGQMTVYNVKVECVCEAENEWEKCVKFLPQNNQSWSGYLGRFGDGIFEIRN